MSKRNSHINFICRTDLSNHLLNKLIELYEEYSNIDDMINFIKSKKRDIGKYNIYRNLAYGFIKRSKHDELRNLLKLNEFDINTTCNQYNSLLDYAVKMVCPTSIHILHEYGAEFKCNKYSSSPIHALFEQLTPFISLDDIYDCLEALLKCYKNIVNTTTFMGETVLHLLAPGFFQDCDFNNIYKLLLDYGIDLSIKDHKKMTVFEIAMYTRNTSFLRFFYKPTKPYIPNITNLKVKKEPLLIIAIKENDQDLIDSLIDDDVDINVFNGENRSPFFEALIREKYDLADFLATENNINKKDIKKINPLKYTLLTGSVRSFDFMLRIGVDLSHPDNFEAFNVIRNSTKNENDPKYYQVRENAIRYLELVVDKRPSISKRILFKVLYDILSTNRLQPISFYVLNIINFILRNGVDVNDVDERGNCAVHAIAKGTRFNHGMFISKFFTEENINRRNNLGNTPLFTAAQFGNIDVIQYLLNEGVNTDLVNYKLNSPLMTAKLYGNIDAALCLSNENNINERDRHNNTILHNAAKNFDPYIISKLLDLGLDPNDKNIFGEYPIDLIPFNYFEHGISDDQRNVLDKLYTEENKNSIDRYGNTKLHKVATHIKAHVIIEYLLSKDLNHDIKNKAGLYAHQTALFIDIDLRAKLCTKKNINDIDILGNSFLHYVAAANNLTLIDRYVKLGASTNAINNDGFTPLMFSSWHGNYEAVKILANIDNIKLQNNKRQTALDYATDTDIRTLLSEIEEKRSQNSFNMLVDAVNESNIGLLVVKVTKDNVNQQDGLGNTLLHYAAKIGNKGIINLLITNGAKNVLNNDLKYPMDMIESNTFLELQPIYIEQTTIRITSEIVKKVDKLLFRKEFLVAENVINNNQDNTDMFLDTINPENKIDISVKTKLKAIGLHEEEVNSFDVMNKYIKEVREYMYSKSLFANPLLLASRLMNQSLNKAIKKNKSDHLKKSLDTISKYDPCKSEMVSKRYLRYVPKTSLIDLDVSEDRTEDDCIEITKTDFNYITPKAIQNEVHENLLEEQITPPNTKYYLCKYTKKFIVPSLIDDDIFTGLWKLPH